MQSQVTLDAIGPLVYGYHENPFEVLGPHLIEQDGQQALAVRAYLPEAQRAWVVDPSHGASRPMRRIHPAGLYEAVVDQRGASSGERAALGEGNPSLLASPYQLKVTYK